MAACSMIQAFISRVFFPMVYLKGMFSREARGKTTTLKGTPLSALLIAGKSFMTGHKGVILIPQV